MNITYLFGAGASAQSMPVIANFADRLKLYSDEIQSFKFSNDLFPPGIHSRTKPSECIQQLISDLNWLINECLNHSSVDTFARKLFLNHHRNELYRLKSLVSDFLIFEQFTKGVDKRYGAFFATILDHDENDNLILPQNVNIISWNYDKQIEFSFGQFYNQVDHDLIENFLGIYPRKVMPQIEKTCFSIIKLNGTIGGRLNIDEYLPIKIDYGRYGHEIDGMTKENVILNILDRHAELYDILNTNNINELDKRIPTILYSWENSNLSKTLKQFTFNAIANHSILVVIGYSFPTFNRGLDRKILESMKGLKKIYVQSPIESIQGVKQRVTSLLSKPVEIELITNVEEFYIPFEY